MCRRKKDSPKGRGVGEAEDWSGVLARSAKSMGAKRPALLLENHRPPVPSGGRANAQEATKTDQELGFSHDPALPKEWGPRNTRKDAKGDERCGPGGPCHIARPDLERGRDTPARSGVACPKNVPRQYLTCPSELVTTSLCLRNGASETREKTRKGMRGVGREMHVTSRDPTLNAVGTHSCAIRRGMSKKRATAIFDLSLRVGPN
jgi:hypothetical protein